jgi:hypothetical protein
VNDGEDAKRGAPAEQHEARLLRRVIRAVDPQRSLVREDRGRLLERHAVLGAIRPRPARIPVKVEPGHDEQDT